MARSSGDKYDDAFLNSLFDGFRWQAFVLHAIQSYGHWGQLHPLRVRPDRGSRADYSDAFDLLIGSCPYSTGPTWCVEIDVKARTREFTTPDSFPFPTIIVEPKSRYDKRDKVPDWYAMVSQVNHGMLFLPGSVPLSLETKRGREYYTAPKEEWFTLEGFLDKLRVPLSPVDDEYGLDKPKQPNPKKKARPKAKKAAKKKAVKK